MKITFKKNYHSKLDSLHYIAILAPSVEHVPDLVCDIFVATKLHHQARIIRIESIPFQNLSDWQTILDVGLTADQYRKAICDHHMLLNGTIFDFLSKLFNVILFEKIPEKTNEKIALFCSAYEIFAGVKYKISPAEIGIIKKTEVSADLLKKFFDSTEFWAKVKSVTYYAKNINELKRLNHNFSASGHPNHWDAGYRDKLKSDQLTSYYAHLRGLGYVAKQGNWGITFYKP